MNNREDNGALPLLLLALFGFGVAIWLHFFTHASRTLFPLLECTEHVNEAGTGTDWEVFTVLPVSDGEQVQPIAAVVRQTLKRSNKVVGQNLFEPATVLRQKTTKGLEVTVSFQVQDKSAKIVSPAGDQDSLLSVAAEPIVSLRCFQLEP